MIIPILNKCLHWAMILQKHNGLSLRAGVPISKYRVNSVHTLGYLQLRVHNFAGLPTTPNVETMSLRAMLPILPPVLISLRNIELYNYTLYSLLNSLVWFMGKDVWAPYSQP